MVDYFVPLAEVDHGSWTSCGAGNTALRYQHSHTDTLARRPGCACCRLHLFAALLSPFFPAGAQNRRSFGIASHWHWETAVT